MSSKPVEYRDIVMKGGITSAIVSPNAVLALAQRYTFSRQRRAVKLEHRMVKKVEDKQDATAIPLKLIAAVVEAAKAGESLGAAFNTKAEGSATDRLGVFKLACVGWLNGGGGDD